MVLPRSDRVSRAPPYSRIYKLFTSTGLSPTMADLPRSFLFLLINHWPGPLSLATTKGVSVDFLSSGYLDVSVLRVRFLNLCIQLRILINEWVSPFGHPWIKAFSQLLTAYRSVTRPSSPANAKASVICSSHTYI